MSFSKAQAGSSNLKSGKLGKTPLPDNIRTKPPKGYTHKRLPGDLSEGGMTYYTYKKGDPGYKHSHG